MESADTDPIPALVQVAALWQQLDDVEDAVLAVYVSREVSAIEYPMIPDVRFDLATYPDVNARQDFRFTCTQLVQLAHIIHVPNVFISGSGDRVLGVEALTMLCYRLSYPGKLSRIQKQLVRSDPSCYRIITDLYWFLDEKWSDLLYFADRVYADRHAAYTQAVTSKTNGVIDGISMFIDGTKAIICRPGKRKEGFFAIQGALSAIEVGDYENLQKACYNGHSAVIA